MIVRPTRPIHAARKASLNIKYEFTRSDGVWMVFIGGFVALTPSILGTTYFCPLAAVVWSLIGTGGIWVGIQIIKKGAKRVDVINYIKPGRANAVTRAQLVSLTGMDDRQVRDEIKRLRDSGEFIISTSRASGYWFAETDEEVQRFLDESERRTKSQQYAKIRQRLAGNSGERLVSVVAHYRHLKKPLEVDEQVRL